MLRRCAPDNQLQTVKVDLSDIEIVKDLLQIYQRIYQHELTPDPLKHFIYMEVRRALRRDFDIKGFLEGRVKVLL